MEPRKPILILLLLTGLAATEAAAQRLPSGVRPEHYDLAFDVDLTQARFEGTETIRVRLDRPTSRIVLHALELELREVTIRHGATTQRAAVTLDKTTETATLAVTRNIPAGAADINIRYSGRLNEQLRGFYLSKANGRSYAVTQFESTDARRAFPSFDEPALKATFAISLTIDAQDTAISNGKLLEDVPGPEPSRHTLRFATTPTMSSYLVAMAVGDFQCLDGVADNIPIRICATPDKKELGYLALKTTRDVITFFNRYYDIKYPFGKLDMVAIPDFAAGAMENTAAIFYRETALLADEQAASLATRKNIASIIAHEVAHQWFGNLVTMRWWDDLWLNEGFATWMETRPLAAQHPEWLIDVDEANGTQAALNLDALASTRPIHSNAETPAEIEETFDVIAYEKGAAVMRMIERYVGTEDFRKGVNAYLARHAYGNATSEDFWRAVSAVSGKPVDRILPTFVNQPGVPLIELSMTCSGALARLTLTQQRFLLNPTPSAPADGRWNIPVCRKTAASSGALCSEVRERVTELQESTCPAWAFLNAGAFGYFRTAYPQAMLSAIASDLAAKFSAPERLSLAGDEWALVRSARHTSGDYLTLVKGFASETTSGVLQEVIDKLGFIRTYLTDGPERPRFEAFVRALVGPLAADVGIESRPSESEDRRALRDVLLNALGRIGNDPKVAAAARAMADRALTGGPPLDPSTATTLLRIAARNGDRALFDNLLAAARRASTPEESNRYLTVFAYFEDPELVERGLRRTLTDEIRSQDAPGYLRSFLGNPSGAVNARAWAFLKAHWAELLPRLSISFADSSVISALSSFCDVRARDDIKAFFAANPRPLAARALEQTAERINNCIQLKEREAGVVGRWLESETWK